MVYAFGLRFWLIMGLGTGNQSPDFPLLSGWVWDHLASPSWLSAAAATLLIWLQALLINALVARNRLAAEINLFPGLFYILAASALPAFQDLTPFHLANTFIILAADQLFKVYKQNSCMDHLFNAGLFVGLASLCYGPYLLFLIPVLFGLNLLRAFQPREWVGVMIGAFVPLFWLGVTGFWKGDLDMRWQEWSASFGFMSLSLQHFTNAKLIGLLAYALLLIFMLLNYNSFQQKTVIEVRKKIDILYWLLFFGLVVTLFSSDMDIMHLLTVSVPCGILLAFYFLKISRSLAEILHLIMIIGVLVLHYLTYSGVI